MWDTDTAETVGKTGTKAQLGSMSRAYRQHNALHYPEVPGDDPLKLVAFVGSVNVGFTPTLFQQLGFFFVSNAQNESQCLVAIVLQTVLEAASSCQAEDACHATTGDRDMNIRGSKNME
jgi:hypothetical protein